MNKDEFINKARDIFNEANSMEDPPFITIIVCGGYIFTDECIVGDYLYAYMDDIPIAKIRYEDIKDIKIMDESDLTGDEK